MRLPPLPPFTRIILYLNVGIFLIFNVGLMLRGQEGLPILQAIWFEYGLVPADFLAGKFWQPITSMFLHGFAFHILGNMILFVSIGIFLERALGTLRFAFLYFVSGLFGALAIMFLQPDLTMPTIGASAAVSGLLGALAVLYPRSRVLVLFIFPMQVRTITIVAFLVSVGLHISNSLQVTSTMTEVSHLGHAAGILGGFLYTIFSIDAKEWKQAWQRQKGPEPGERHENAGHPVFRDFINRLMAEQNRMRAERDAQNRQQQTHTNHSTTPGAGEYYQTADGRIERVINPESTTADQQSHREQTRGHVNKRTVYFDPATGRFYIQTG